MSRKITAFVAVLATGVMLALGGAAYAQTSPTQDAYGGQGGAQQGGGGGDEVAGQVDAPSSAVTALTSETSQDDEGGGLPFTGLTLVILLILGTALIAAGYAVRKARRSSGPGAPA